MSKCCSTAGYGYTAGACKTRLDSELGTIFDLNGHYDATLAARCLQSVSDAMNTCQGMDAAETNPCASVFTGTEPPGQRCELAANCARVGGGYAGCLYPLGAGGGGTGLRYCTLFARQKAGMKCNGNCVEGSSYTMCGRNDVPAGSNADCYRSDGLYCAKSGVCAPLAAVGQPCSQGGCVDGAYCDNGTCAPKVPAGSTCSLPAACQGWQCMAGSCVPLKDDGASCGTWEDCKSGLCPYGRCGVPTATRMLCGG